jgi:acetyl esterase
MPTREQSFHKGRRMLQAAGVAVEKFEYPNAPHGFTYKPSPDTTDAVNQMAAFLKKYLF